MKGQVFFLVKEILIETSNKNVFPLNEDKRIPIVRIIFVDKLVKNNEKSKVFKKVTLTNWSENFLNGIKFRFYGINI